MTELFTYLSTALLLMWFLPSLKSHVVKNFSERFGVFKKIKENAVSEPNEDRKTLHQNAIKLGRCSLFYLGCDYFLWALFGTYVALFTILAPGDQNGSTASLEVFLIWFALQGPLIFLDYRNQIKMLDYEIEAEKGHPAKRS